MAACYFMGARSGKAKKSGNWYGCFYLLHKDNFGQWAIDSYWFDDEETFNQCCEEVEIGFPVVVGLNVSGKITSCVAHDTFPPLDLAN